MCTGNADPSGMFPGKFRRGSPPLWVQIQYRLPVIEEIVRNELYYEAERRNCPVERNDKVVSVRVADIVMRIEAYIKMRGLQDCPPFSFSAFLECELRILEKIQQDERWYLMLARRSFVPENDEVLRRRVADIVVEQGDHIRYQALCDSFLACPLDC
ncbi:MAG: hypothetical protein ACI9QL_002872 [Candidatus Omnitrophota bacterium]|jgi:hypothetical protein